MTVGGGCVKTWSSTQASVAQSSGEAEYYAMVRAAAEALSLQSIMRDLGWESTIRVWVGSAAVKSIASRIGLGKMRHMEVKFLCLQEAVKAKRIFLKKVAGCQNPADVLTKPQGISDSASLLDLLGFAIHSRDV